MNLNMLLKLGNLICAHADNAKFIYKPRNICSQPKKKIYKNNNKNNTYMCTKIHIYA